MAELDAKLAREKKGIKVSLRNPSDANWVKDQEEILGGKIVKSCPPSLESGKATSFGLAVKNAKAFEFRQQWISPTGEKILFSILYNKGGGRTTASLGSDAVFNAEAIGKFERMDSRQPGAVQWTIKSTVPSTSKTARGGKAAESESWTSSEDQPKKKKFSVEIAPKSTAPSKKKKKTRTRDVSKLTEEQQIAIAIEQSQVEEAKRLSKLQNSKDETAMRVAVKRSKTDTSVSDDLAQAKEDCWQFLQQGIALLDQGQYESSLPLFTQSIGALVKLPNAHQTFTSELTFAAAYFQAGSFLLEMQRLLGAGFAKQMGVISARLAELEVQPNHRLIHARLAIKINFQLGNFGICSKLLQLLIPAGLPEVEVLQTMLEECEKQGNMNHAVPTEGTRLCHKTFRTIRTRTFAGCQFCKAIYRPHIFPLCSYCNFELMETSD
eukprot:TRINITY_DN3717_c0_g1_i1.p1 TRINITY_DN3717_c0_g1~~TRINITY_DN3717_c0_g1_i1.p1  ORF type:complete len:437 (-),score=85.89 TRINITY_DN3717_c0_g1_i1:97-1407(-)